MPQELSPRLSHVGIFVTDVPKMREFYTQVLGFVISDAAEDGRITFMSRNPSDHHQVVLVRGRGPGDEKPLVQQVSFNVAGLEAHVRGRLDRAGEIDAADQRVLAQDAPRARGIPRTQCGR